MTNIIVKSETAVWNFLSNYDFKGFYYKVSKINFSEKFVLSERDTESIKSEIAALGIKPNDYFDILYNDMKLLVARELYGMEGYYLTKNETDRDFLGALQELKNNEFFIKE